MIGNSSPVGSNLHRKVMFGDGKIEADLTMPMSDYDSTHSEDLWQWTKTYEEESGGRALAILHNGNLSRKLMFDDKTYAGKRLSREYAEQRMQTLAADLVAVRATHTRAVSW